MAVGEKISIPTHAHLKANLFTYQGVTDFINGDRDTIVSAQYVVKYQTELDPVHGPKAFGNRLARTYFTPYTEPYLAVHYAHLSQTLTLALPEGEAMQAIEEDGTGFGEPAETLARDRMWYYLMHGRVATVVEGPSHVAEDGEAAAEAGERSYQSIFTADQIKDWAYFTEGPRRGQLCYVCLVESRGKDKDGNECETLRRYYYDNNETYIIQRLTRVSDKQSKTLPNDQAYEVVQELEGQLSQIPVVIWGEGPNETMAKQLFQLNVAALNLNSILTHINYNQGFQRSFLAGGMATELTAVGESIITALSDPNARIMTLEAGNPTAIKEELNAVRQHIRRVGLMEHNQLQDDTAQVQSAESKAADRRARLMWYHNVLDRQEDIETQIYQLHAEYEGVSPDAVTATFSRDFGLDDEATIVTRDALTASMARELGVTPVQKEVLRVRVNDMQVIPNDGQTAEQRRTELLAAVESAEPVQPFSFGNTTGTPPAANILDSVE